MKNFLIILCCLIVTPALTQCSWYADADAVGNCGSFTLMIDVTILANGSDASLWSLHITPEEFWTSPDDVLHYGIYDEGEHRIFVDIPSWVASSQSNIVAVFSDAPSPGMGFCQENAINLSLGCISPSGCGGLGYEPIENIQGATCEGMADGSFELPLPWNAGGCYPINAGDVIVEFTPEVPDWSCQNAGGNIRFLNFPAGDYTMNVTEAWGGQLGCGATYQIQIPETGVSDFGFTVDEVDQPSCEYYPYPNDISNYGVVHLVRNDDEYENLTYEIYNQDTQEVTEPFQVYDGPGYAAVYGFEEGAQCLRVYEEGVSCPQEFCFDFDYEIAYDTIQYEIIQTPEFFGDDFQIQFYMDQDYNMYWNTPNNNTGADVATFLIEDGDYFYIKAFAESSNYVSCEMNNVNIPSVFEYLPGFDVTYSPTMCDASANGKVVFRADQEDLPLDVVLEEIPENPDLDYELIGGDLHIYNLDTQIHCYQLSSASNPNFNQDFCVQTSEMTPPSLPSSGNVVVDPTCGNAFDGGRRVSVNNTYGLDNLLQVDFTSYLPESNVNYEPYLEQVGNYYWIMGLGEGLNEVTGTHPNGCTFNWNINMDESGSGTLSDVNHTVISYSDDGVIVELELEVYGTNPWSYSVLSEATDLGNNQYLVLFDTEMTVESCPDGFGTECCDLRTFAIDFQFGCTNDQAENYDPNATEDDGSCIFPPLMGDFDGNNTVNAADLLQFLSVYGQLGQNMPEDMNQDDFVNAADLLMFLSVYGLGYE